MKRCGKCSTDLPRERFHRNRCASDGLQSWCKACQAARPPRPYVPLAPGRERERKLIKRYGMTQADFDALLAHQGGQCAICARDLTAARPRGVHVDHDHATGEVRGILCAGCNSALGRLERVGLEAFTSYMLSDYHKVLP